MHALFYLLLRKHHANPYLEFDAHKAARTYAAFAQALRENELNIAHALRQRRAESIEKHKALHPRQPAPISAHVDYEKSISWAIRICEERAAPMAASLGRAWLPLRDVETLLRMESGQALALLLETGDLHQAIGVERPKL